MSRGGKEEAALSRGGKGKEEEEERTCAAGGSDGVLAIVDVVRVLSVQWCVLVLGEYLLRHSLQPADPGALGVWPGRTGTRGRPRYRALELCIETLVHTRP